MSAGPLAAAAVAGLAVGSVPFGLLLSRWSGARDPRTVGSGNVGATNVVRSGGLRLGATTLVLDAVKGLAPALAFAPVSEAGAAVAGLAAVLGHCYSPWLGFRGGKGVATLLGLSAALAFPSGLGTFVAVWAGTFLATRFASLASLGAAWSLPVAGRLGGAGDVVQAVLAAAAGIVTLRHAGNLRRLLRGEEHRFRRTSGTSSTPDLADREEEEGA